MTKMIMYISEKCTTNCFLKFVDIIISSNPNQSIPKKYFQGLKG